MPKHEGHATVASRAPQWSQRVAPVEADAPHIGQFNVSAGMMFIISSQCANSGNFTFREPLSK